MARSKATLSLHGHALFAQPLPTDHLPWVHMANVIADALDFMCGCLLFLLSVLLCLFLARQWQSTRSLTQSETAVVPGDCRSQPDILCPWCRPYLGPLRVVPWDLALLATMMQEACQDCVSQPPKLCQICARNMPDLYQNDARIIREPTIAEFLPSLQNCCDRTVTGFSCQAAPNTFIELLPKLPVVWITRNQAIEENDREEMAVRSQADARRTYAAISAAWGN